MTELLTQRQDQNDNQAPAGPIPVPWAAVPRVNLLPIAVVQGRGLKRTQRMLAGVVLTGVAICAAGGLMAQQGVDRAEEDLSQAQSQVVRFRTEAAKYSAVPSIVSKVKAAQAARTSVMASDVLWYRFLNDLEGALPAGVMQDTMTVTLTPQANGASGAAAGSAGPLSASGIGTLTVTGEAGQYRELSAWLDALDAVTGVASPALTSATKTQNGSVTTIKYSLTAVVTAAALSHRYDKEGS